MTIHQGLSLRQAKKLAKALGVVVTPKRRTGEVVFQHPSCGRVIQNNRKTTANRHVILLLRKAQALVGVRRKQVL